MWKVTQHATAGVLSLCLTVALVGCSSSSDRINVTSRAASWRNQAAGNARKAKFDRKMWSEYLIGPGDLIEITVFQNEELKRVTTVTEAGTITMPLIGEVSAAGHTAAQLADRIAEGLNKQYLQDAHVVVFIKEYHSRSVVVIGAVKEPGSFELKKSHSTLVEMIGRAGGMKEDKAGDEIIVIRTTGRQFLEPTADAAPGPGAAMSPPPSDNEDQVRISVNAYRLLALGDLSLNVDIFPGDVIRVPVSGVVRISGDIKKPDEYPIRRNLSLLGLISVAGDLRKTAKPKKTKLIRQLPNGKQVIVLMDLEAIADGRSEDIELKDGDYVRVPVHGWKSFGYGTRDFVQGIFGMSKSVP